MQSKIYDYIIIGRGIAGCVCAFKLESLGFSCLILEKTIQRTEKICGGGIPFKAICKLQEIGMDIDNLYKKDVSIIRGDMSFYCDGKEIYTKYDRDQYSIGCTRIVFDDFLLGEAIKYGAEIKWDTDVKEINRIDDLYSVCGFLSNEVVVAAGARGLRNNYYKGQSMGISAQVKGNSNFSNDTFMYYYFEPNRMDKYFWIFPNGKNKWNIGIWSKEPYSEMREDYEELWKKYIVPNFSIYEYIHNPTGEFCGNISLNTLEKIDCDSIGDYAGVNNINNGGGIYRTIKSVIKYVDSRGSK